MRPIARTTGPAVRLTRVAWCRPLSRPGPLVIAELNGIRLGYSDTRSGSPCVLLVHGYLLNRSMWEPQRAALRASGARVIALDLRGFGASEPGPPGPLTMDQHADDLAALLDHLDVHEPVVMCALSMG